MADVNRQVNDPSAIAAVFQLHELQQRFTELASSPLPDEARRLIEFYQAMLIGLEERAWEVHKSGEAECVREIYKLIHAIAPQLRYLHASRNDACPSCLQTLARGWLNAHFGRITTLDPSSAVVLVRSQWEYNFAFKSLIGMTDLPFVKGAVDARQLAPSAPEVTDLRTLYKHWWKKSGQPGNGADLAAAVSISRLDTADPLLFPLLAHEAAHTLDFSSAPNSSHQTPSDADLQEAVLKAARKTGGLLRPIADSQVQHAIDILRITLQNGVVELAADLIAARIAGPAYFIALAEFLKSKAVFKERVLHKPTRYPGISFRLQKIYEELYDPADIALNDVLHRILQRSPEQKEAIEHTMIYMRKWYDRAGTSILGDDAESLKAFEIAAQANVERLFIDSIPALRQHIRIQFPRDDCFQLSDDLGAIIGQLFRKEAVGVSTGSIQNDFASILFAAWTFELYYGEDEEATARNARELHGKYSITCSSTLSALLNLR